MHLLPTLSFYLFIIPILVVLQVPGPLSFLFKTRSLNVILELLSWDDTDSFKGDLYSNPSLLNVFVF